MKNELSEEDINELAEFFDLLARFDFADRQKVPKNDGSTVSSTSKCTTPLR